MAKRPHVPKFGDWNNNGGNVPYTTVFNKARKGKLKNEVKIMNPNDPEENVEVFHVDEKEKVYEGIMKIKFAVIAEENGDYSSKSETIDPRSSHIRNLSQHRNKNVEAEPYVRSEKMTSATNISSHILPQGRKQRLRERFEKQSMNSLPKQTGLTGYHRKHPSASDIYMVNRPHIPKFGDWNNKGNNLPYTVVFNNARKSKLKDGVKIMNPNDPEENPEAFAVLEKVNVKEGLPIPIFQDGDERNPKSSEDYPYKFTKVKKEKMSISEMFSINCFLFRTKQRCQS